MKYFPRIKTSLGVFVSATAAVLATTNVALANPPASPYAFGFTLDPACAPGDANCTVAAPTFASILASSSSTGANDISVAAGQKLKGGHGGFIDLDYGGDGNISLNPVDGKTILFTNNSTNLDTTEERLTLGRFGTFAENGDRIVIDHEFNSIILHAQETDLMGNMLIAAGKQLRGANGAYIDMDADGNGTVEIVPAPGTGLRVMQPIRTGNLSDLTDNTSILMQESKIELEAPTTTVTGNLRLTTAGKKILGMGGAYIDLNYGGTGGIEIKPANGQVIRFTGDLSMSSIVNADQPDGRIDLGNTTRIQGEYGLIRLSGSGESGGGTGAYIYAGADGSGPFINVVDWDVDPNLNQGVLLSAVTTTLTGSLRLSTAGAKIVGAHNAKIDLDKNSNGAIKLTPATGRRVFIENPGDASADWGDASDLLTVKGNFFAFGHGRFDNGVGIANDGEVDYPLTVEGNMSVNDILFNAKAGQGTGRISNIQDVGFVVSAEENDNLRLKGSNGVSVDVMGGEDGIWLTAPTTTVTAVLDTKTIRHKGDFLLQVDELPGTENGNITIETNYGSKIHATDEGVWIIAEQYRNGPEISNILVGRDGVTSFNRGTVQVSNNANFTHRLNGDNSNMFQVYSEGGWSSFEARNEYTQMGGECGTIRVDCAEEGTRINSNLKVDGTVRFQNVSEHADNVAAVAAGLPVGTVYRTGELLKIVY